MPVVLPASDAGRGPRPDDPKCLTVRIPRKVGEGLEGPFVLKWAVCRDGRVGNFTLTGTSDDPGLIDAVRKALRETIQGCRWIPGTDPQGKPIDVWMERTFRFSG